MPIGTCSLLCVCDLIQNAQDNGPISDSCMLGNGCRTQTGCHQAMGDEEMGAETEMLEEAYDRLRIVAAEELAADAYHRSTAMAGVAAPLMVALLKSLFICLEITPARSFESDQSWKLY